MASKYVPNDGMCRVLLQGHTGCPIVRLPHNDIILHDLMNLFYIILPGTRMWVWEEPCAYKESEATFCAKKEER